MPFRSATVRQSEDVAYLRGPGDGLDEGEWIAYWERFPHSLTGRLTNEATRASIDTLTGQLVASFDTGIAAIMRLVLGIVDWNLMGEDGAPVKWEPARGRELVDGLLPETFIALSARIGNGPRPASLGEPVDDLPNAETVGNASGGS